MSDSGGSGIELVVNGEPKAVDGGMSLAALVESLEYDPRLVAVERNGQIVPRAAYGDTELVGGDRLEIVRFVQGGSEPTPRV